MSSQSLLDHFSTLEDPRQSWKVLYPLPEVLLVVLCGTMAGADDFAEIERWGRRKLDFLRRLLPFADGIPSHDTLNDVMNALSGGLFAACFTAWVEALREAEPDIVAIDGKSSRRAYRTNAPPLHLVSAWASRQRLVLGQQAVALLKAGHHEREIGFRAAGPGVIVAAATLGGGPASLGAEGRIDVDQVAGAVGKTGHVGQVVAAMEGVCRRRRGGGAARSPLWGNGR